MDGYLAVISKREVREYSPEPLPEEQIERILQAGRATGSSKNRQPWEFVVVTDRQRLEELAETVRAPRNVRGCAAAIALVMQSEHQGFDAGRCAQNMMVAAWADGVGSCPNSVADRERAMRLLGVAPERHVQTVLSLGYPAEPWSPEREEARRVLRRVDRKPLVELARRI